jgi:hypothetical protein
MTAIWWNQLSRPSINSAMGELGTTDACCLFSEEHQKVGGATSSGDGCGGCIGGYDPGPHCHGNGRAYTKLEV